MKSPQEWSGRDSKRVSTWYK